MPSDAGSICLTADSRPLLRSEGGRYPFLEAVGVRIAAARPRAAYIGASNRDEPAFYSIFEAAMDVLRVGDRRMILSGYGADERAFTEAADLIVLAGGDVLHGWGVIERSGMGETVVARHRAGAVLLGVSAGAVQLGVAAPRPAAEPDGLEPTLGLLPWLIDVHAEADGWQALRRSVLASRWRASGLAIASGGAVICDPGGALEVCGAPLLELVPEGERVVEVWRARC